MHPLNRYLACLLLSLALPAFSQPEVAPLPALDASHAAWVGERIFANECNSQVRCLTSWNAGEDFPSLGIGHFIWYREGQREAFVESFPQLLAFYREQGMALPAWIDSLPEADSPWQNRQQFLEAMDSEPMLELREFLNNTREVQVAFIIQRMEASLPALLAASSRPNQIEALFREIAAEQPLGPYALIDYVNFKGEGIAPGERYAGQGWGLLQVLEYMLDHPDEQPLMDRFAQAAGAVLIRRIANAPPERGEQRWQNGWLNRVQTYSALHNN